MCAKKGSIRIQALSGEGEGVKLDMGALFSSSPSGRFLVPFPESLCSPVLESESASQMTGVQCYVFD